MMRQSRQPIACRLHLEQVYRAKDQIYIRYSVTNQTKAPFRVTTPDVCAPLPTEQPISLVSLRNHQITSQTFAAFKARQVSGIPVTQAESAHAILRRGRRQPASSALEVRRAIRRRSIS